MHRSSSLYVLLSWISLAKRRRSDAPVDTVLTAIGDRVLVRDAGATTGVAGMSKPPSAHASITSAILYAEKYCHHAYRMRHALRGMTNPRSKSVLRGPSSRHSPGFRSTLGRQHVSTCLPPHTFVVECCRYDVQHQKSTFRLPETVHRW